MQAMIEDLSEYQPDEIQNAFVSWRQKKTKIPTPADILEIIRQSQAEKWRGMKKLADFQYDWDAYRSYLLENGYPVRA